MDGGSDTIKLGPFGTTRGGTFWDEKGHGNIVQIFISHDNNYINSIQYQYADKNGKLLLSELHGKPSNNFEVVKLNYPKEFITWIRGYTGYYGDQGLRSITFGTNLGEYGPFGKKRDQGGLDTQFSVKLGENRQFFGFYGTVYNYTYISSIGIYLKPNTTLDLVKNERIN